MCKRAGLCPQPTAKPIAMGRMEFTHPHPGGQFSQFNSRLVDGRRDIGHRGSISLLRGWSDPGTGFSARWSMPQACQYLRGVWTMPFIICFNFGSALKCSAVGLDGRCRSLPTVLFYLSQEVQEPSPVFVSLPL